MDFIINEEKLKKMVGHPSAEFIRDLFWYIWGYCTSKEDEIFFEAVLHGLVSLKEEK